MATTPTCRYSGRVRKGSVRLGGPDRDLAGWVAVAAACAAGTALISLNAAGWVLVSCCIGVAWGFASQHWNAAHRRFTRLLAGAVLCLAVAAAIGATAVRRGGIAVSATTAIASLVAGYLCFPLGGFVWFTH